MRKDKILLLVRLVVTTSHTHNNEAIKELEAKSKLNIPSTKNVRVLKAEILKTHQ